MNEKIQRNPIKVIIVALFWLLTLPLMVLFYVLRSAWEDSANIGWWLRPALICPHGVDRNRQACDPCNNVDMTKYAMPELTN